MFFIWCKFQGHAGHDEPPHTSIRKVPALIGNEHKFGLHAQLDHKIEFIKRYVPDDVKIHFIGHSIGAWMVLELLKIPEIKAKTQQCYLLFPTVERMATTTNGFVFTKLIYPLWFILRYFYIILAKFPQIFQVLSLTLVFFLMSIPKYFMGTSLKYARPTVMDKVIYLANEEMKRVLELDIEHVKANKDLLKFYYGARDGWVPTKYCHQLIERVPGIRAEIDIYNIAHAFVLSSSAEMGKLVSGWIMEHKTS